MVKVVTINRGNSEDQVNYKDESGQSNFISLLYSQICEEKSHGHEKIGTAILLLPQNVVNYTFKSLFNNVCIGHRKP